MSRNVESLYAITPDIADTHQLVEKVRAAILGGVRVVQYRNKTAAPSVRLEQAIALAALCAERDVGFVVNDDADLAARVGADGVHLGKEDGSVAAARDRVGRKWIGVSCYNELARALAAQNQGADYVAFGSFFFSGTKPNAVRAPLELLRQAKQNLRLPLVAIGGITPDNAASLIGAGADSIAVSRALFEAADITATARAFSDLFEKHTHDFT